MHAIDYDNINLSDVFPLGDLNHPRSPPTASPSTDPAPKPKQTGKTSSKSKTLASTMQTEVADDDEDLAKPFVANAKPTKAAVKSKSRFLIKNPKDFSSVGIASFLPQLPHKGRSLLRVGRRGKVLGKTAAASDDGKDGAGSDSDANNYGGGYSNGNGYGYSEEPEEKTGDAEFEVVHGEDEGYKRKGPKRITHTKMGYMALKKAQGAVHRDWKKSQKRSKHYGPTEDDSTYSPEDPADYKTESKYSRKKGKRRHRYAEDEVEDEPQQYEETYSSTDGGYSDGGNAPEPHSWELVHPEQLVCGACPANSMSKGGLIGGSFCQPCKDDEEADTKNQVCSECLEGLRGAEAQRAVRSSVKVPLLSCHAMITCHLGHCVMWIQPVL